MTSFRRVLVALATLVLLLGCQSPTSDPGFGADETTLRGVLVAPLNLTIQRPLGFEASPAPVWQALISHLRSLELAYDVLDPIRSESVWEQVMDEAEGEGDTVHVREAWSRFARRASEMMGDGDARAAHEWVLIPSLILRSAPVRGRQVSWDGVHRDLAVPFALDHASRSTAGPSGIPFTGYRGQLAAASLHVAVLTAEGHLVWEGLGGLDLVQEIDASASAERDAWRFRLRSQPFGERAHVQEGVALAFARRLPGSEPLAGGNVATLEDAGGAPPASLP